MNSRTVDETSRKQNEVSPTSEQKGKSEKKTVSTRATFKEPKRNVERQLSGALAHLRSEARQTTSAYLANLERDIVKVTNFVHDCQSGKSKDGAAKRILQIQEVLDNLEVKPEKGRRKDLKRIEKTVAAMLQVTD
jgi:cell division septum initiation protein DivIVA